VEFKAESERITELPSFEEDPSVEFWGRKFELCKGFWAKLCLEREHIMVALRYRAIYDAVQADRREREVQPACLQRISERVNVQTEKWERWWKLAKRNKEQAEDVAEGIFDCDRSTLPGETLEMSRWDLESSPPSRFEP
jgi:hypothetical protein